MVDYPRAVPVSQRFIDLLNMPGPALRRLAAEQNVEYRPGAGKWDIARAVARSTSREELEDASDGFLYAGSTSMSWFLFVAPDDADEDDPDTFYPLEGEELDLDDVREALDELSEGDPFDEEDRPDSIDREPKLVLAREWRDGIVMTFAVAKRAGQVIHDFEIVEVLEDEFFSAFLRIVDGVFEVRSSSSRAHALHVGWLGSFAAQLDLVAVPVSIEERDVRALRDVIGGRLAKFGGNESTGTSAIGTVTFGKSDLVEDLFEEQEFADRSVGYDPVAYDLLFDHDEEEDIRVHISTLRGSVFIRNSVPEAVMRYIYDSMRSAKT